MEENMNLGAGQGPKMQPAHIDVHKDAVPGMVIGILSIVFCEISLAGIILAIIGLKKSNRALKAYKSNPEGYKSGTKGMALAGKITSIIGLVASCITVIYWIYAIFVFGVFALAAGGAALSN